MIILKGHKNVTIVNFNSKFHEINSSIYLKFNYRNFFCIKCQKMIFIHFSYRGRRIDYIYRQNQLTLSVDTI